ncbi:hypothetical protein ACEF06_22375 [Brevibacillus agri]
MNSVNKKVNQIEPSMIKFGMGNRELLMVMTLRAISNGTRTAKEVFEEVMPYYPGRSRSMAFLYEVLKDLEKRGLLASYKEGRTSIYSVTEAGMESFWSEHEETCRAVYLVSTFLLAKLRNDPAPPIAITRDQQKMFNRFINVREMVSTIFMRELSKGKRLTGRQLMDIILNDYSWYCSKGYMYEILHSLMGAGLVDGEWDHPIRRNMLTYQITSLGEELLPRELQGTVEKLRGIRSFMETLNHFFRTDKKEPRN